MIQDHQIFELKKLQLIRMGDRKTELSKDTKQFIERIEKILSFGHYFAFNFPLTVNFQKQAEYYSSNQSASMPTQNQFSWNGSMIKPLVNQGISESWHLQLIQGFVKQFRSQLSPSLQVTYSLVSRRSNRRSGTRCNHRGADTDGSTANFVEHESIYEITSKDNKITVSHVQIRGSLPILWEQNGLKGNIGLAGGEQISLQAYRKHMKDITENYGKIFSISLMAEGRSGEKLLTSTFKKHYEQAQEFHQIVAYDTFDIKCKCKGGKYENINPYVKDLTPLQHNQSYFVLGSKTILQKGVIRTNCKSSLDRTNIFQSKIELNLFQIILRQEFGLEFSKEFGLDAMQMMENQRLCLPFVREYKALWSENGDNISQHYAGTNALTSHATKTGQVGLFGKLQGKLSSIKRFYEGRFQDSHKQETTDIILGKHGDSQRALKYEEELKKEASILENQFIVKKQISVYIVTWSLGRFLPSNLSYSLQPVLDFEGYSPADIIAFCFQKKAEYKPELLDVKISNLTERQFYLGLVMQNIKSSNLGNYSEVDVQLAGTVCTVIVASDRILSDITKVEHEELTQSVTGKGTVVIKANVKDSKLCFINTHLSPGISKSNERISQLNEIHVRSFQSEGMSKYKKEKIEKADKVFLAGNLNSSVNIDLPEASKLISNIQELTRQGSDKVQILLQSYLQNDQLREAKKRGVLQNYQEGPITFMPTFKMVPGRISSYDISTNDAPSWCDRILMWNNESNVILRNEQKNQQPVSEGFLQQLKQDQSDGKGQQVVSFLEGMPLFYSRREIDSSDHRPVCAYYVLTVREEDNNLKQWILKDIAAQKIILNPNHISKIVESSQQQEQQSSNFFNNQYAGSQYSAIIQQQQNGQEVPSGDYEENEDDQDNEDDDFEADGISEEYSLEDDNERIPPASIDDNNKQIMTEGNEDMPGTHGKRGYSDYDTSLVSFRDSNQDNEPIEEQKQSQQQKYDPYDLVLRKYPSERVYQKPSRFTPVKFISGFKHKGSYQQQPTEFYSNNGEETSLADKMEVKEEERQSADLDKQVPNYRVGQ